MTVRPVLDVMFRWHLTRLALVLVMAFAGMSSAVASSLSIAPVRVDLSERATSSRLDIQNRGNDAVTVQIGLQSWQQTDDGDRLVDSDDLVFNPPLFRLEPGQHQIVRVGLRKREPVSAERAYRLFVTEIAKSTNDDSGLQVNVRMGLPVFVAGSDPSTQRALTWQVDQNNDRQVVLTLSNQGSRHIRLNTVQLLDAETGREVGRAPIAYCLPGANRRWRFDAGALRSRRWIVRADIDGQITSTDVQNSTR